jgi:DNA-binding Lrp family transcriptional regulator
VLDKQILNTFQKDFPLTARPYGQMAEQLGVSEAEILERLRLLRAQGVVSRVGVVFQPRRVGISTLAAMRVPTDALDRVANLVSAFPEVNHNYEREHPLNLWFVVTAPDEKHLLLTLKEIQRQSGYPVLAMPMEEDYHIDLGFPLHLS